MALTTLLDYKAAVKAAGYDGAGDTELLEVINEARRTVVEERRWSWREAVGNTDLALAYDTPSEALNGITDLLYVNAVRIEFGTERPELAWKPIQELRDLEHDARTPGVPRYWSHAAGQIRVWPSPDRAYTLSVDYVRSIVDLTADADEDEDIPTAFKSLVKWKAVQTLAFRQREAWAMDYADREYQAELRRKVGQDGMLQRQTSHQVRSGYWGTR